MHILGIDTSFDDTAASVVRNTTILSNILSSDLPIYQEWGGVVPRLARLSHEQNIDSVIQTALKRARVPMEKIDAIAVTYGPGLSITLEVGIAKAKELSATFHVPIIAINHMEGHLLSFLASPEKKDTPTAEDTRDTNNIFPSLAVLVSGGHTEFVFVPHIGTYEIVGEKQDDAMGEAFDKVGRMLGLGYPAGALIEKFAKEGTVGTIKFPVPMRSVRSADTSFSGLKTAAMRIIEPLKEKRGGVLTKQDICDVALGFQTACVTHLIEKLTFALEEKNVKSIVLGGGVAANATLRSELRKTAKKYAIPLYIPYSKKLCVDNAAMIALAGYFKAVRGEFVTNSEAVERDPIARLTAQAIIF